MLSKEEKLFYEKHIPAVIKQISRLADAMDKSNTLNEKLLLVEKKKLLLSKPINESNTIDKKDNGKEV